MSFAVFPYRVVRLAVLGGLFAAACVSATASRVYVENGQPRHMHIENGVWQSAGGYYGGQENNATVSLGDILTTGDFSLRIVMRGDSFTANPGLILVNQLGEIGFVRSDSASPMYVRGFFFGDIHRNVGHRSNFFNDADDFAVGINRVADTVRVEINGKPFWRTTYEGNRTFGKIGFRRYGGNIRIKHAELLSGNVAPISAWINPRAEKHEQPGEQVDVFSRGKGDYHTYRIPALEQTKNGTLLAFCEGRRYSGSDSGSIDLLVKRSTDGGRTWEEPIVVHSEPGNITIGNPVPIYDRGRNRTVLVFCRNNDRVFVTSSRDDGLTWETPWEITADVKLPDWSWYATGPCHGLLTEAGRMIVPANHGTKAHTIYSDDYGQTWQLGGIMGGYGNEVSAAEASDGRILLNSRNSSSQFFRRAAISADGGETWQASQDRRDLVEPTCQGNMRNVRLENGEELVLFSNPASVRRERLTVRISDNDGTTWSEGRLLYGGSAAYSDLCYLGDGWVGCLYERNWYDHLTFARFHVSWLRASRVENWQEEEVATD